MKSSAFLSKTSLDLEFKPSSNENLPKTHSNRTPPKEPRHSITIIMESDDSNMNFKKWVICLISLGIMLMSPMICYLGFEAASYGFARVIADKALILLSILTFIFAIITLLGTIYAKINILIFVIYMNLVLVVFDSIFSIGCFTFSAAIQTWVYDNWDQLREEAGTLDIEQFAENFENSLISLGFFSFTISIGLIISNISILLWIPFNSSATIVIAFQTRTALDIWFQISQSEEWVCYLGITVSFIWTIVGCVGYYASLKKLRGLLKAYLGCMVFTTVLLCALGIFLIVFAYTLEGEVANKWSVIEAYLNEIGEAVPIEIFTQNLDEVVKFAGLYALAFFIFNLIGIGASSYQLNKSLLV